MEKCPEWQAWLCCSQVPLLAVWGKNDTTLVKPHLLDEAHFAVESCGRDWSIDSAVIEEVWDLD